MDTEPQQDAAEATHVYHHDGGNMPQHGRHDEETLDEDKARRYWRDNIRLLLALLSVWFIVSFGCGILFTEQLNAYQLGGFKLGFWFAQQGAIYVFVALIFVYAFLIHRLERKYGIDDDNG